MIITEIKCVNFFRFYGDCTILCNPTIDRNITVVRGENGMGKTTILNAFYFCLYGDVTPPLFLSKMLNELANHELAEGNNTSAKVEISFTHKDNEYTAVRERLYKKTNGVVNQVGEESFNVFHKNPNNGNSRTIDDPDGFFEGIIPNNLRGFFFFDGERIDRLAKIDGRGEIKDAILNILGLTKLEYMKERFEELEKDLARELKKYQADSNQDLNDRYEVKESQKIKKKDELAQVKASIKLASENIERISAFLLTCNSASIQALENERIAVTDLIKRIDDDIKKFNKEIINHATRNFKHSLVSFAFNDVFTYLEGMREKGQLPSDIKEQFIDDLIMKRRCICERELIEGEAPYEAVMRKRANAGRSELDNAYIKITAYITQQKESMKRFFEQYFGIHSEIIGLEKQKDAQEKRLAEIKKDFDASKIEQVKMHENEREQLDEDLKRYYKLEGRLDADIEDITKKMERISQEIQNLEVRGAQGKAVKQWRNNVLQLGQLNTEIHTYFIDTTRINLDERIREVFDSMKEKEYRFARLTDDFVLEITNNLDDGDDKRVLSTGEGQIASLAFIASLVSYAREKTHFNLLSDFGGGDFPIVMDSPFGNLSAGHKQNVAREIGNLASQVIVVVSNEQWSASVEASMQPRINAMYMMSDGVIDDQKMGEHTIVRRQK